MPFNILGTYACQNLQAAYVDYFGKNSSVYKTGGSTSLIKWLLSPQNTRAFRQINIASIPGKRRGVAFRVDNPFCFDVCNPAVDCTVVRQVMSNPSQELVFDMSGNAFRVCDGTGKPVKLQFKTEDLLKYCTDKDSTYIQGQIFRYLSRFEEALDKQLTSLLLPFAGTNATGGALTRMPFFVNNTITNSFVLNPDALWLLGQNFDDIGGQGQYAMVGGRVVSKIMATQKWTGLNAAGIDLNKIDDLNPYPYYDKNFDISMGQNQFLQMAEGAAQLVVWNQYVGERARAVTDLYSNGTIVLPSTGLTVDWTWRYDYECEAWVFEAFLYAELAVNKAGGCGALSTTNGIIRYEDCSDATAVPVCAP